MLGIRVASSTRICSLKIYRLARNHIMLSVTHSLDIFVVFFPLKIEEELSTLHTMLDSKLARQAQLQLEISKQVSDVANDDIKCPDSKTANSEQ